MFISIVYNIESKDNSGGGLNIGKKVGEEGRVGGEGAHPMLNNQFQSLTTPCFMHIELSFSNNTILIAYQKN
jgi:hypothetical protein